MKNIHSRITVLIPMVEGIVGLLYPYAEGAIHDLKQGKIIALYNNISKRKIGDPSVVTELGVEVKDFPDVFDPYYKTNWDGRKLKCTSVTVRDDSGVPIALVCINFDTTVLQNMSLELEGFLRLKNTNALNPVEQFAVDWRKQADDVIAAYAAEYNISPAILTKKDKIEIVQRLFAHGLFNYRDAATYIASTLHVSRTTIYNYLKEA